MLKQIDFYLSIIYYRVPFILVAILPYVYKCNEFSQRIDRSIDRFLRNSKTRKACHGYGHGYYCRTMIHPAIICLARNLRPSYLSNVKQIRRMDFYDGRNPADRVGVGRTMEGNVRVKDINSDRHCVRTYIYTYVCVTWCVCVCVCSKCTPTPSFFTWERMSITILRRPARRNMISIFVTGDRDIEVRWEGLGLGRGGRRMGGKEERGSWGGIKVL